MIKAAQAESTSPLVLLNYGTPLVLLVYYTVATACAWCYLQDDLIKPVSKKRRSCLISLGFITTSCYLAQSLSFIPRLASAPDDGLIHSISQTLLWGSFSLISLEARCLVSSTEKGFLALNLLLETIICTLTILSPSSLEQSTGTYALSALQIITLIVLSLFSVLTVAFSYDESTNERQEETQPLLAGLSHSSSEDLSASDHSKSVTDDTGYESDGSHGSDSTLSWDEHQRVRDARRGRLSETGGWIGYLKSFSVFVPYIIPTKDLRLQAYTVIILICTLLRRVFNVLHPRQLGIIINVLSTERRVPWKDIFLFMAFEAASNSYCGLGAVSYFLEYRLAAWSRQQLTIAALDHVMGLSMDFHDQKDSGEVIKAIEQAGSLNSLFQCVTVDILPGVLDMLIAIWYVTHLFDAYAMLIVVTVSLAFLFATYFATFLATAKRRLSTFKERLRGKVIYESVSNWYTIMCMNTKDHTMSRLSDATKELEASNVTSQEAYNYMFMAQDSIEILGRLAITILAARRIASGQATVGDLVTLETYWDTISEPLNNFGYSFRQISSELVDAERLLQVFQEKPTVKNEPHARDISSVQGRVIFDNVRFGYPDRDLALSNLNITAEPGQMIALVGETGGGKSTIMKLLMRFYDVTGGSITIDDHDIRDFTLESLRSCFGFVPQDTILFNLSILENVRYANVTATDDEVYAACRAASIHDKILSFPNGYASKVGERGVKLSGGERQRIAIARVFLKNPQIVLLDEATSAMDSQTEAKIQDALKRLISGRTTFVIAHRLSTVVEADQILVIHDGRVVESGTHEQLLSRGEGRYHRLWTKQVASMSDREDGREDPTTTLMIE